MRERRHGAASWSLCSFALRLDPQAMSWPSEQAALHLPLRLSKMARVVI